MNFQYEFLNLKICDMNNIKCCVELIFAPYGFLNFVCNSSKYTKS